MLFYIGEFLNETCTYYQIIWKHERVYFYTIYILFMIKLS